MKSKTIQEFRLENSLFKEIPTTKICTKIEILNERTIPEYLENKDPSIDFLERVREKYVNRVYLFAQEIAKDVYKYKKDQL